MSKIIVTEGELGTYQGPETDLILRIFASKTFWPSTGGTVVGASTHSLDFYQEVACSVVDGVVTYPNFTIDSTTDADANPDDATYAFILYTTRNKRVRVVHTGFRVPTSTPTTLGAIAIFNNAVYVNPVPTFYTDAQVDALIAAALGALTFAVVSVDDPAWIDIIATKRLEEYGNNLATAHTSIGSTPTRLLISKPTTLSSTKDFPATCRIEFTGTGNVTIAAGCTLTIRSMQDPGNIKCFTLANSSTSHLRFSDGAVARINTAWITGPGGGDISIAMREALASCSANGKGCLYTPAGTWTSTTAAFDYPTLTDHYGEGSNRTIFQNNSSTYWARFGASVYYNNFKGFSIKGVLGLAETNSALRWWGTTGEANGFQTFDDVSVNTNHIGIEMLDSASAKAFNVNNVVFLPTCFIGGNDRQFHLDTFNMDLECHAYVQTQWRRTGGDYTNPVGYSQAAGVFDAFGRVKFTRELAGLSTAYNPGGGSTFNGYGNNQVQQIIIDNADNVTVGGTALVTVKNANMVGDSGLGSDRVVSVALTTAHNTAAKIADAIRLALAKDTQVSSAHHVAYNRVDASGPREINLIYLDPAATDTTGALSINPNGVVGLSTYASSTRLPGKASFLPTGFLINSAHSALTFDIIDEGYEYSIKNAADDDTASLVLNAATIQSPIICQKKCTLVLNGGTYVSQSIRDGGTDGSTYLGPVRLVNNGATVAYYSNFWLSTGQSIQNIVNRRVHNFGAANDSSRKSGIAAVDIDHVGTSARFGYPLKVFKSYYASVASTSRAVASFILSYIATAQTDPLIEFGVGDNDGQDMLYGWQVRHENTGSVGWPTDLLGWAKWVATQAFPYGGWDLAFPLQSKGMVVRDPSFGMGYVAGAGGPVTQGTDKSTKVTLNTISGEITMHNAALAANTIVSFWVVNSAALPNDVVGIVQKPAGGTAGAYFSWASGACPSQTSGALVVGHIYKISTYGAGDDFTNVGAASNTAGVIFTATGTTPTTYTHSSTLIDLGFQVNVWNVTAGSLSEAVKLQFNINRGAIA